MRADVGATRIEGGLLADLYASYSTDALKLAYLLTGDRGLAEDLVQDAFVRMAGRLVHLRAPGGFQAYLRTTIVNMSRSHFRRRAVERRYAERQSATAAHVEGPDLSDRDSVRNALLRLPIRQRTAVVLRFYEDMSETQIAEAMRCRPGTVKSLISRGVANLRGSEELTQR